MYVNTPFYVPTQYLKRLCHSIVATDCIRSTEKERSDSSWTISYVNESWAISTFRRIMTTLIMKNIASNAPSQLYLKREAILDIKCVNNEKAEHREDGRVYFFPLDLFFSYMEKDGEQFNCIPTTGSDLLWVSKKIRMHRQHRWLWINSKATITQALPVF